MADHLDFTEETVRRFAGELHNGADMRDDILPQMVEMYAERHGQEFAESFRTMSEVLLDMPESQSQEAHALMRRAMEEKTAERDAFEQGAGEDERRDLTHAWIKNTTERLKALTE